jgi:fido (protein-threonine AMPylation protein)
VSDVFEQPDDAATPLTVEEQRDLIPSHISNRRDLNEAEQENILRGQDWALRRRKPDLLSEKFITDLHKRMLGDVWRWAGDFRCSERNLGIPFYEIPAACANCWTTLELGSNTRPIPPKRSPCAFITVSLRSIPSRMATAATRG